MNDSVPETEGQPGIARAALFGLCPRCGARTLFDGVAKFAPQCPACKLDYTQFNVGDGPAAFLTLIVGALIVGLALWLSQSSAGIVASLPVLGALALGAALGVVALIVRQEVVLFIMGGVFVAETVSVILQVGSYKLTGRRIFRMAPLHHHFELKGWPEPKIIVRFWIVTLILVLIGLATLKVR